MENSKKLFRLMSFFAVFIASAALGGSYVDGWSAYLPLGTNNPTPGQVPYAVDSTGKKWAWGPTPVDYASLSNAIEVITAGLGPGDSYRLIQSDTNAWVMATNWQASLTTLVPVIGTNALILSSVSGSSVPSSFPVPGSIFTQGVQSVSFNAGRPAYLCLDQVSGGYWSVAFYSSSPLGTPTWQLLSPYPAQQGHTSYPTLPYPGPFSFTVSAWGNAIINFAYPTNIVTNVYVLATCSWASNQFAVFGNYLATTGGIGTGEFDFRDASGNNTLVIPHLLQFAGNNDTVIGSGAAPGMSSANNNTVVGSQAAGSLTTGGRNTVVGQSAGYGIIAGIDNTAVGNNSLGGVGGLYDFSGGTALGVEAGGNAQHQGTWLGSYAGTLNAGMGNFWAGSSAGSASVNANWNTVVGENAYQYADGGVDTVLGNAALMYDSDGYNTVIGAGSMKNVIFGESNAIVGDNIAEGDATTFAYNSSVGSRSMAFKEGSHNSSVGAGTYGGGSGGTGIEWNASVGENTFRDSSVTCPQQGIFAFYRNSALGGNAGRNIVGGHGNIFLGYESIFPGAYSIPPTNIAGQLVIGSSAEPITDVWLGGSGVFGTIYDGEVIPGLPYTIHASNATADFSNLTVRGHNLAPDGNYFLKTGDTMTGQFNMVSPSGNDTLVIPHLASYTGKYSTVIGDGAAPFMTTASNNTLLGYGAGATVSTGGGNTLLGSAAGSSISAGINDTAVGKFALGSGGSSDFSGGTAIGSYAGFNAQNSGTFLGSYAGWQNTGVGNFWAGSSAGAGSLYANFNTIIGEQAYQYADGGIDTVIGNAALMYDSDGDNTVIGAGAGKNTASGYNNVLVGDNTLGDGIVANQNTVVGSRSMRNLRIGDNNTAVGYQASRWMFTNCNGNVSVGVNALFNTGGSQILNPDFPANFNTAVGASAGASLYGGVGNIFLGAGSDIPVPTVWTGYNSYFPSNIVGQMIVGGSSYPISDVWIGNGVFGDDWIHSPVGNTWTLHADNAFIPMSNATVKVNASNGTQVVNYRTLTNAIVAKWGNHSDAAYWTWTSDGTQITLAGYSGPPDVVIPDMLDGLPVTSIGGVLSSSGITSVSGGNNVEVLGYGEFNGCAGLFSVYLPQVRAAGELSFSGCQSLYGLVTGLDNDPLDPTTFQIFNGAPGYAFLPSLKEIDIYAFSACGNLTVVDMRNVSWIGRSAFANCPLLTVAGIGCFETTAITEINLPLVKVLGGAALWGCVNLTSVHLPLATSIGGSAFYGCSSLTSVYLSQDCPVEEASVYSGAPSAVTYVNNPTATGWGTTWNGNPVVRMSMYGNIANTTGVNLDQSNCVIQATNALWNSTTGLLSRALGAASFSGVLPDLATSVGNTATSVTWNVYVTNNWTVTISPPMKQFQQMDIVATHSTSNWVTTFPSGVLAQSAGLSLLDTNTTGNMTFYTIQCSGTNTVGILKTNLFLLRGQFP